MGFWQSLKNWWNDLDIFSATETFNVIFGTASAVLWLTGIIIITVNYDAPKLHIGVFGRLLFFSAAAFVIGLVTGFFFGIPKTLQRNSDQSSSSPDSAGLLSDQQITNTNLEQISDWLTKIVVGLGLVNFKNIPGYLDKLRVNFEVAFPGVDKSIAQCAVAVVIYASISGFISMYIYTRVNISALFLKNSIDEKKLLNDLATKLKQKGNEAIKESFIKDLSKS
jgi:hypothetical protein